VFKQSKRIIKKLYSLSTKWGVLSFLMTRSSRRRTTVIIVDEKAKVCVYAPFSASEKKVLSFVEDKAEWILEKVCEAERKEKILDRKKYRNGEEFLFLGKKCKIQVQNERLQQPRIEFKGHKWMITLPLDLSEKETEQHIQKKLISWYREQAKEILGQRLFRYSREIQVEPKTIAIRTQKRLWGNCDYNEKKIHLNWQIILSPIEVIDYVIVHELCHLIYPNHNKRFWNKVGRIIPDYKKYQKWLRLHATDMVLPTIKAGSLKGRNEG